MQYKIVADSSSDLLSLSYVPYQSVPLKLDLGGRVFVDDEHLDVDSFIDAMNAHKGPARTACPSPDDFIAAFGDAERVFCVTITSNLSGCNNSACLAAREYEAAHPGRKVFVLDTLSTGAEMILSMQEIERMILAGEEFEAICRHIKVYLSKTRLIFMLKSLKNLAANGRVSPAVAKLAGLLGIRIVGKASDEGTLEPIAKCRGEKKALSEILDSMLNMGYQGGRLIIHHCRNLQAAQELRSAVLARFPKAEIVLGRTRGLCSFYAEDGGMILGFETA